MFVGWTELLLLYLGLHFGSRKTGKISVVFEDFFKQLFPFYPSDGTRCCGSDWPWICCFVINPCVLSANRVDLGFFLFFHKFSNFTPPPPSHALHLYNSRQRSQRNPEPNRDETQVGLEMGFCYYYFLFFLFHWLLRFCN